eukprot:3613697-Pleurochrysis_carterae.AAC.1
MEIHIGLAHDQLRSNMVVQWCLRVKRSRSVTWVSKAECVQSAAPHRPPPLKRRSHASQNTLDWSYIVFGCAIRRSGAAALELLSPPFWRMDNNPASFRENLFVFLCKLAKGRIERSNLRHNDSNSRKIFKN